MKRTTSTLLAAMVTLAAQASWGGPPLDLLPDREYPPVAPSGGPPPPRRPEREPSRPFPAGSMDAGLVVGVSTGDTTSITLGGNFGYFILPGLEPGVQLDVTFGSDVPTVTSLLPYLRWVFWRSYVLSPYVKVQGGHWFISERDDLSVVGGGGGVVFFLNRYAGVQLEAMVFKLFPESVCQDDCLTTSIGVNLGFFFGGGEPAARRAPARPPPPPPAVSPVPEAHEAPRRDEPVPY